jgi:salicylate hydroxylase
MTAERETPTRSAVLDEPLAVIGGGIGGLTAALALQRFGFRITVFEQAQQLREIGAGVAITPNAMHALDFLGVGARVLDASGPAPRYEVCDADSGRILEMGPPAEDVRPKFGAAYVNARRADLHTALADAILARDPDCVRLDHRFEHLEQDADGVDVRFSNGERIRAAAVIGCDGGASRVRSVVFGHEEVAYTGQTAFRALVPAAAVPAEIMAKPYRLYVGRGRTLIHYEVSRGELMNLLGIVLEPCWQAEGWTIPAEPEEFLDRFIDFPEPVRKLIHAVSPGSLYKWGLRDRNPLETWISGRVAMLGDAAHPFLPFLGQGACVAIEDGLVLGRALAVSPDLEQGFARYEAARKQRANGLQLASREQGHHHQGVARDRPSPGNTAAARGLFSYNPATVPV